MRSGGNNFNYFVENKLTTLANLVHFKTYAYVLSVLLMFVTYIG